MKLLKLSIFILVAKLNLFGTTPVEKIPEKKAWKPVLKDTLELHEKSTHPAANSFEREWEEIGPVYHLAPAFGH